MLKHLESSAKCQKRGRALGVGCDRTRVSAQFRHRTEWTLQSYCTADATHIVRCVSVDITDDEEQLRKALPLVHNRNGHFLATLSALHFHCLKAKLTASGVFGATNHFVGFNSACPIADHAMLTVGRSARDLLRKKIAP